MTFQPYIMYQFSSTSRLLDEATSHNAYLLQPAHQMPGHLQLLREHTAEVPRAWEVGFMGHPHQPVSPLPVPVPEVSHHRQVLQPLRIADGYNQCGYH